MAEDGGRRCTKIFFLKVLLSIVILFGICPKYMYSTLNKHQNMNSISMKPCMMKGDSITTAKKKKLYSYS